MTSIGVCTIAAALVDNRHLRYLRFGGPRFPLSSSPPPMPLISITYIAPSLSSLLRNRQQHRRRRPCGADASARSARLCHRICRLFKSLSSLSFPPHVDLTSVPMPFNRVILVKIAASPSLAHRRSPTCCCAPRLCACSLVIRRRRPLSLLATSSPPCHVITHLLVVVPSPKSWRFER